MGDYMLQQKAADSHKIRKDRFKDEIDYSVRNTELFCDANTEKLDRGKSRYNETKTSLVCLDIQNYILTYLRELEGKTAVLNFASYNNPGGKYMNGMMAQEEALCHASTLYEVLINNVDYYSWNNRNKNRGLYTNRLLYTPKVVVLNDINKNIGFMDVITCAAPNASVGLRYGNFTEHECRQALNSRMLFLMHVAAYKCVDNLILGAWGCGVFKNDPHYVARMFYAIQSFYDGFFKNIIYVVPKGANYNAFLGCFAG